MLLAVHGVGEESVQGREVGLGVVGRDLLERLTVYAEVQPEDAGSLEV